MLGKIIKKIWLIWIWIISLSLTGCFHVPDKDRLPSKNKVETWDVKNNDEIEKAIDSLIDWINIISSEWNDIKDIEDDKIDDMQNFTGQEISTETWFIDNNIEL